eukprot:scaffold5158_cov36-Cyclotella_meneghiniana.AAC.1
MDMVPSSEVLPTLMREVGKSLKVSAWVALLDKFLIGSFVTNWALLVLPLATPTHLVDLRSIGKPAFARVMVFDCFARLRALRADGLAGAATVVSSVSGGSSVADEVAKA